MYGPRNEPIATLTRPVSEGDTVSVPELDLTLSVLDIPGHTRAHIAYYGAGMLFCGDTLFACGCGRLFEGTAEQMYASLQKLVSLPDDTLVYCGHEYTLSNIRFAKTVEPANAALEAREARDRRLRDAGKHSRRRKGDQSVPALPGAGGGRLGEQVSRRAHRRPGARVRGDTRLEEPLLSG